MILSVIMNATFNQLREKFIDHLKSQKRSVSTILAYGNDISQFINFLEQKKINDFSQVKTEDVREFKEFLLGQNYTSKSVFRKLNSLRTFFRWLKEEKIIKSNPALEVPHPKVENSPPRALSELEYRALRDVVRDDPRMYLVVELLLQTGLRVGELERLQIEDIGDKELKVRAYENFPERTVPLNNAARKAIENWLRVRPKTKNKTLLVTRTGKPLLVRNIRTALNRYFQEAGIKKASINSLRHTFIVQQLAAGVPVELIQKIVGHKRLASTERYLDLIKKKEGNTPHLEEL